MLTIAHATALADEDRLSFEHGVAMARITGARLLSVTANPSSVDAQLIPSASEVLARWGGSDDEVRHERIVHECCDDPVDTLLDALRSIEPGLVIASTHQRSGLARFFSASRAEALAANLSAPTLIFPVGAEGFLREKGEIRIDMIVVPCGDRAAAQLAIDRARWLVDSLGLPAPELALLHAVEKKHHADLSGLELPDGWRVHRLFTHEALTEALGKNAGSGCLIVMATRGHDSLADSIMGSHTDRALRVARCPILVVPMADALV